MEESVVLEKHPPQSDGSVIKDGIRSYLKNYGLLAQRLQWATENENPNLPVSDLNRYVSNLIEPVAFQGGVEVVKSVKEQDLFDGDGRFEPIMIESVIERVGSYGGLLRRKSSAKVQTSIRLMDSAEIESETVTFPPSDWFGAQMKMTRWHDGFDVLYSNPQEGDIFRLYLFPSEDGVFQVGFSFERD